VIYKIRHNVSIFEDNPGLLAVEKFEKLEDRHMKFVCLVCDPSYDNPVRTLPERERREKAAILVGYPLEDGKRLNRNGRDLVAGNKATVEAAIEEFRKLHFDDKQDTLETTRALIETNKQFIKDINAEKDKTRKDYGKDLEKANKFHKELPELIESYQKIEELLKVQYNQKPDFGPQGVGLEIIQSVGEETGNEELSTIDQYMANLQKNKES
jgi:hypothetical protein